MLLLLWTICKAHHPDLVLPTNAARFMDSLNWVDKTYYAKHEGEDSSTLRETYYPNLRKYSTRDGSTHSKSTAEAVTMFLMRFGKKAGLSLAVFALSYVSYVGRLVLPAASFYTFKSVAGLGPAAVVFGTGIFLPRRYLVIFLQSYFASRSLMRELVGLSITHFATSTDRSSSNLTSPAYDSPRNRRSIGSMIEKASYLDLVLGSTSSCEFLFWAS
jgi:hypothetical protein